MRNKLFTLLFSSLLLLFFSTSFGQSQPKDIDSRAEYSVNPNPHSIFDANDGGTIEETFGLNQNVFGPAGLRGRGNIFFVNTPRTLVQMGFYLNPTTPALYYWLVYEGAAQTGIYNLVLSPQQTAQGPGEGWYFSPIVSYEFQNGMWYGIWLQWDVNANYWNENPVAGTYPIPASFGELQSGVGWNWAPLYGDPPLASQDVQETFIDPVAYYQKIFTDDIIPVELTSFTYAVSGNDITLNWQTATETNNHGFEVQRNFNGSFETIGFVNGFGTSTELHSYSYIDSDLQPGVYEYRLKQVDLNGTFRYYDPLVIEVETPASFALQQNYPNPFNPSTKITYSLAIDSKVSLKVFNLLGENVSTIVNENLAAGEHAVNFNASNLNSGVYFYRIDAVGIDGTEFSQVRKMLLTK